ncbi:hypothetical protein WAE56_00750 [Iodobacter sp. LRB]|uniref:ABC transporter substrate-binding protein n=1 Tax=unclassified Iodobacter TaxID=235634 RepID=UPI000C1035CC|nr:hypothetical protein [Iodobacter sp. BJB302]PHV03756.1 hypothetical protein CSQ88_00760 [Iodobacter sp. BJB302]
MKVFLIFILLSFFNVFAAGKQIVVVESYHKEYKWDAEYRNQISDKLGRKYQLTFFEMNTKRLPPENVAGMAEKALKLIDEIKPALVILGDDAALEFLGEKIEERAIPAVYLGINKNPRSYFKKDPKYISGILERPLFQRSSYFIKTLLPKAKKVLILFDGDRTSSIVFNDSFMGRPSLVLNNVVFDVKLCKSLAEWKKEIEDVGSNNYDAVVIGLYQSLKNEKGLNADAEEVLAWTNNHLDKPLFAFWDFAVGKGKSVGGFVLQGASQGKAAADMAEKILQNPDRLPGSYWPVFLQEGTFVFSRHELARWKIQLPADMRQNAVFVE